MAKPRKMRRQHPAHPRLPQSARGARRHASVLALLISGPPPMCGQESAAHTRNARATGHAPVVERVRRST